MSSTDIATWVQAVGSAGSLLAFATWVGIAVLTRRDEHERYFDHQARQVAAWIDLRPQGDDPDHYVVCLANGADTPVYRCRVLIPALWHDLQEDATVFRQLLPPRTTVEVDAPRGVADLSDAYEGGVAPPMDFTDSSGRRWHRDHEGRLSEQRRSTTTAVSRR